VTKDIEVSISCTACVRRGTSDCADCLVTHVLGDEPETLELTGEGAKIARLFVNEGLVPRLRYVALGSTHTQGSAHPAN